MNDYLSLLNDKKMTLIMGCDDSIEMQELRMHEQAILKAVNDFLGSTVFKKLRVDLKLDKPSVTQAQSLREQTIPLLGDRGITFGSVIEKLLDSAEMQSALDTEVSTSVTVGKVMDALHADEIAEENKDKVINQPVTLGQVIDFLENNEAIQKKRDYSFEFHTSIGEILEIVGEEKVKDLVMTKTAAAAQKPEYERSVPNVVRNWLFLCAFICLFAVLATISLELIDKDKR